MSGELVLYSLPNSFYSARCRAVAYTKEVELRLLPPPGGLGSPEFRAISPLGKVPALLTHRGVLIESQVICEYLDDLRPHPPLRPDDPWDRAQAQVLCRFIDLYLAPLFTPIWRRIRKADPPPALSDSERATVRARFLDYDHLLASTSPDGRGASLPDCALAPVVFLFRELYALLGEADPIDHCPRLLERVRDASRESGIARALEEMAAENARRREVASSRR